jgi:hypothetical protein
MFVGIVPENTTMDELKSQIPESEWMKESVLYQPDSNVQNMNDVFLSIMSGATNIIIRDNDGNDIPIQDLINQMIEADEDPDNSTKAV